MRDTFPWPWNDVVGLRHVERGRAGLYRSRTALHLPLTWISNELQNREIWLCSDRGSQSVRRERDVGRARQNRGVCEGSGGQERQRGQSVNNSN